MPAGRVRQSHYDMKAGPAGDLWEKHGF